MTGDGKLGNSRVSRSAVCGDPREVVLRDETLSFVDANFVETIPGYSAKRADEQGLLPSSGSVSPGSTNLRRHLSVNEFICLSCLETASQFGFSEGVIAFG